MSVEDRKLYQPVLTEKLTRLHHALVAELTTVEQGVEADDVKELSERQSPLDVELNHRQLLAFLLLDVEAEELLLILSDHKHVRVLSCQVLSILELVRLDLLDNLLEQALLSFSD